jgi:Tfp pilus assembly PilM family ATPase
MNRGFLSTPEFLSLPLFGLSITHNSIKFVKMEHTKYGLIPAFFEEIELSEVCDYFTNPSSDATCDSLKNALKNFKKKYNISFAQISIPEEQSYVFKIFAPKEAITLMDQFIINNVDQYIPLSASDIYFDYKILESQPNDMNISVIVTAIPKFIVEKYALLLDSCGILMLGCEPETHAISRCVIDRGDKNPYIIMHVDTDGTKISVIEEGFVQYTQTVSINSDAIKEKISQETTQILKDTLNRVIIYWFTSQDPQNHPTKIENVILSGVGVDSPDFVNFFESNLNVNTTHANVWKNCFDLSKYIPKMSRKESLKYAVCVGLSMFNIK